MQYFLFIYLFFLTFLNQEIKVISYNIRYNNPNDGKDIWENRRSSVVDFIKNENPDFLGLQEVTLSQLTYLNTNLTEYSYVGVGRDDGKTKGEYSPIYYKKSLFELIKTETFWLSKTPGSISVGWDASMERICTYGYFKVRNSDKKLWIFNSHFDHIGEIAREESAKLILKKISELSKKDDYVILTGDFNSTDTSKTISILSKDLNDTNFDMKNTNPVYGTYNGFKLNPSSNNRIDYIFEKNFNMLSSGHLHVKNKKGRWVSDHNPVYANLKFK